MYNEQVMQLAANQVETEITLMLLGLLVCVFIVAAYIPYRRWRLKECGYDDVVIMDDCVLTMPFTFIMIGAIMAGIGLLIALGVVLPSKQYFIHKAYTELVNPKQVQTIESPTKLEAN